MMAELADEVCDKCGAELEEDNDGRINCSGCGDLPENCTCLDEDDDEWEEEEGEDDISY